jgi:hypothetical protein
MLFNLKQSKSQFILAIDTEAIKLPKMNTVKVGVYPSSELPKDLDLDKESIFFTSLDKKSGMMYGFKLSTGFTATKVWQISIL